MPDAYYDITAQTTAQIISASGSNAQMQAWGMDVCLGSMQRSQFGKLIDTGVAAKRPIKMKMDFRNIRGQVANFQSRAPLGASPGVQGSGNNRVGLGENRKFKMWTMNIGVQWQGVKSNNIAKSQTVLGMGDFDGQAREGLKDLFKQVQSRTIEATMMQRKTARTTIYANGKTSVENLRSADTFTFNMMQQISDQMANNMAAPIAVAMPKGGGQEPIRGYYVIAPSQLLADMEQSSDYQTLMANSQLRGDSNTLFYGGLPMIGGSILDRFQVQADTSDGPKGTLGAPMAFLGNALIALPVTGEYIKGGGSAAAAAITDPTPPLFFQLFPNAQFQTFEVEKIAAASTEKYVLIKNASNGKFGFYAYTVNDGNKLTLTKALRSTNATSGKLDFTTVGGVTYGTAPWTTQYITDTNAIGDLIIPCNSFGQPYVAGYGFADEALWSAYGMLDEQTAMGRRTILDGDLVNHGRETEIGLDMNWGCEAVSDANDLKNGFMVIYGAFNISGMPVIDNALA